MELCILVILSGALRGWGRGAVHRVGREGVIFRKTERGVVSGCLCNGQRRYSLGVCPAFIYPAFISDPLKPLCALLRAPSIHPNLLRPDNQKVANPKRAWKERWEGIRQRPSAVKGLFLCRDNLSLSCAERTDGSLRH